MKYSSIALTAWATTNEKSELINRVWTDSFVEEGNLKVTVSMLHKSSKTRTRIVISKQCLAGDNVLLLR